MYLLDTNIIIGILREASDILDKYRALPPRIPKAITTFSAAELYEGLILIQEEVTRNVQKRFLELMLDALDARSLIFTLTRQDAALYADLRIALRKNGTPIPVVDLLIGTIALATNSTLITTDQHHFQMFQAVQPAFLVEYWGAPSPTQ